MYVMRRLVIAGIPRKTPVRKPVVCDMYIRNPIPFITFFLTERNCHYCTARSSNAHKNLIVTKPTVTHTHTNTIQHVLTTIPILVRDIKRNVFITYYFMLTVTSLSCQVFFFSLFLLVSPFHTLVPSLLLCTPVLDIRTAYVTQESQRLTEIANARTLNYFGT